jgi:hypothetical protein
MVPATRPFGAQLSAYPDVGMAARKRAGKFAGFAMKFRSGTLPGMMALCVAGAVALPAAPASAQGFFEALFGGLRRAVSAPPQAREFADPFSSLARAIDRPPERTIESNAARGPARAFCVRTCDGHYFPVLAHPGLSVAQACHAFCPASETRIYSGRDIDYAVARDGSRYAALKNAYAYRKHLTAGCTCNGRTAFGLAHIAVADDPTLRPGDVVATKKGLVAYTGEKRDKTAAFTPVENYSRFSKSYREMLSAVKIMPPNDGAPAEITSAIPRIGGERSAQLER